MFSSVHSGCEVSNGAVGALLTSLGVCRGEGVTAMATDLLICPSPLFMELLRLSRVVAGMGEPVGAALGVLPAPFRGARCDQSAQGALGGGAYRSRRALIAGEVRGRGGVGFAAHPARTSQACSFALVAMVISRPPPACTGPAPASPTCLPPQSFCDWGILAGGLGLSPARDTQPVFPSCHPASFLFFLPCSPQ